MANNADFRFLGRDQTMRLTQNGELLTEVTAISMTDFKPMQTLLSEGFLGEIAKRHREVFDEIDVAWTVQPEGKAIFQMQEAIYQRARGSLAGLQINLGFRIQFPSGTVVKLTIPDLKFGTNGDLSVPGREQFGKMSWAAKAQLYIPSF